MKKTLFGFLLAIAAIVTLAAVTYQGTFNGTHQGTGAGLTNFGNVITYDNAVTTIGPDGENWMLFGSGSQPFNGWAGILYSNSVDAGWFKVTTTGDPSWSGIARGNGSGLTGIVATASFSGSFLTNATAIQGFTLGGLWGANAGTNRVLVRDGTTGALLAGNAYIGLNGFIGDGEGMTNVPLASLNTSGSVTFSNTLFTTAPTALGTQSPADNEIAAAGWVRSLFNVGADYFVTTNIDTVATNAASPNRPVYKYQSTIPLPSVRQYATTDFLTNNAYVGCVITTNTFSQISGQADITTYLGFTGGGGGPTLSIHPEIYYSYDRTNWLGDWSGQGQSITPGVTNQYDWTVSLPRTTSTNAGGFYLMRCFKVNAVTGTGTRTLTVLIGTNSLSGTTTASHTTMQSPDATVGNAFLANNQTFTGSNTFTGGIFGKLLAPTKQIGFTNYTSTAVNSVLFGTGTNQIVTLPSAAATTAGTMITLVAATTTGSLIVTNATGAETILGGLSVSVGSTNRLTVISDGSNWW